MLRILVLTVALSQVFASESSEELASILASPNSPAAFLLKGAVASLYDADKYDMINKLIKSFGEEGIQNFTLIGTQNVYGDNGAVETRSIEYHWFKKNESSKVTAFSSDSENEDDDAQELQKVVEQMKTLGLEFTIEQKIKENDGGNSKQTIMDSNVVYEWEDNFSIQNKTFYVETMNDVKAHVAEIEKNYNRYVSILRYNSTQFVKGGSSFVMDYFVTITEEEGNPHESILGHISSYLTMIGIEQGLDSNVPEKLRAELKNSHPEYNFFVVEGEPDGWWIADKGFIKVVAAFNTGKDDVTYTVYGNKA